MIKAIKENYSMIHFNLFFISSSVSTLTKHSKFLTKPTYGLPANYMEFYKALNPLKSVLTMEIIIYIWRTSILLQAAKLLDLKKFIPKIAYSPFCTSLLLILRYRP